MLFCTSEAKLICAAPGGYLGLPVWQVRMWVL